MEIVKRYGQIMACNVKYLVEKSDNEEKIIKVYLREITEEIKGVNRASKSVNEEESMLSRELDSYKKQISSIEIELKESKDKDYVDSLVAKKDTLIRNINKISKRHDIVLDNKNKINFIKVKLNNDIKFLSKSLEALELSKKEAKANEEIIDVADEETKSIINSILSRFEKKEK